MLSKVVHFVCSIVLYCIVVSRRVGCIHALVGEAAAVRILVNLCGQSKYVASSQSSKGTILPLRSEGAVDEETSKGQKRYTLFIW